ncbi:MAG TPA: 1-(5-phosphoribosyl)-5-[(5-phosphoribosylamino)methylideneamino]imidazole-4-carboxamide isomerase [Acidimicrobiia bacterium]|nr:1-(5-phosphoribosyl)-5-[(5-phosphoribosylamino)methylideneamino]imidazole-4-carboxamide isomerase [Acidimicrobiia bacterium]
MFDIYPAIDLRGGRCVRLHQGDFEAETVYDDDPVQVARAYQAAGTRWIHVVDLDAARTGTAHNLAVIEAITANTSCRIQSGGGVRSVEAAGALLSAGVARVVVGTAAVERPELVEELATLHPGAVAVGLDVRGREVATRGWERGSGRDLVDAARAFDDCGAAALIVTQIERDGTLGGPDLDTLTLALGASSVPVIASGGVAVLDDLRAIAALAVNGRRCDGVIVGKALYEGRFTLAEAQSAVS